MTSDELKERKRARIMRLYDQIKPGKKYRPADFKSLLNVVSEYTIWGYLNNLEDRGFIKRDIVNGRILFERVDQ
jgi:DNA-binding HxlR family transcriptional regulator